MNNILSVDVEDYFHPSEVQSTSTMQNWDSYPSRVVGSTMTVLELFAKHNVKATFFVLGWVAQQHPKLVQRIAEDGHEIGCHSHRHQLVYDLTPAEFEQDTRDAVQAIIDACGVRPVAYRAPSYSITSRSLWALEVLVKCGFRYDSSIYPVQHDRYGIPGFSRHPQTIETPAGPIMEVPIATVQLPQRAVAPIGGGAYLRLLPYRYTAAGLRWINQVEEKQACMYLHPWELDPDQPRLAQGVLSRLRTYAGLNSMKSKVDRLLTEFPFSTLSAVYPLAAAGK